MGEETFFASGAMEVWKREKKRKVRRAGLERKKTDLPDVREWKTGRSSTRGKMT